MGDLLPVVMGMVDRSKKWPEVFSNAFAKSTSLRDVISSNESLMIQGDSVTRPKTTSTNVETTL